MFFFWKVDGPDIFTQATNLNLIEPLGFYPGTSLQNSESLNIIWQSIQQSVWNGNLIGQSDITIPRAVLLVWRMKTEVNTLMKGE